MTVEQLLSDPPAFSRADWNDDGVYVVRKAIPEALMVAYEDVWMAANGGPETVIDARHYAARYASPHGWAHVTPHMDVPALMDLAACDEIAEVVRQLIGEPGGVHLSLTGWVSTERDWHQDSYLKPPHVGDFYAAAWVALETIDPDSGPFQFVPGSHRWPQITREAIGTLVDLRNPKWPKLSERWLTPYFEGEIERRGAEVVSWLPERGDLLLWHGRLLHRGSPPVMKHLRRKALIMHYSGVNHRQDMPPAVHHPNGGWYFPIRGGTT